MKHNRLWWVLTAVVVIAGAVLRLSHLSQRPLHTDEAVHADKCGILLDQGIYRYDPNEYHGPTLNYLSVLIAKLRGQTSYQALDEITLRLGPALIGLLTVLLPLGLWGLLDKRIIFLSMAFTALSPAMVYYSRYYIQETLLVCFTVGLWVCIGRYLKHPRLTWVVLGGVCAGLMHATKETCMIAFGCIAVAGWIAGYGFRDKDKFKVKPLHGIIWLSVALLTSATLYSCFFTYGQGILDSWKTYGTYLQRAGTEGTSHHHGGFYYLDLLTWVEFLEWPPWNEDYTIIAGLLGVWWAFRQEIRTATHSGLIRWLALYTALMLLIYSLIPYKTPWCVLGFLHGLILLSAFATVEFYRWSRTRSERMLIWGFVVLFGLASPVAQATAQTFKYDADPTNPYVYAHTSRDIFPLVDSVNRVVKAMPGAAEPVIQVVCPDRDYWPLPWYLRHCHRVGYWTRVDPNVPAGDIIIAHASMQQPLLDLLYERPAPGQKTLYVPLCDEAVQLRPGVPLQCYIRKDLWDLVRRQQHEQTQP